jgi:dephospho-CoA kinase
MPAFDGTFGLTGGVASGKSTVARYIAALGARVIDADRLGHELMRAPLPAYGEIVARFGREVLDATQEIDRTRLGALVFGDAQKLGALNAILHPRIIKRSGELAAEYRRADPRAVVVVDAALIIEAGMRDRFIKILVAWCRPEQQIERLMAKGVVSREEAERRVAAQMPTDEKRRLADFVIDCSGSKENTQHQVETLYPELQRLAEGR